ncbi:hypothetical protein MKX03_019272, partial [Papaver bracteatum]
MHDTGNRMGGKHVSAVELYTRNASNQHVVEIDLARTAAGLAKQNGEDILQHFEGTSEQELQKSEQWIPQLLLCKSLDMIIQARQQRFRDKKISTFQQPFPCIAAEGDDAP